MGVLREKMIEEMKLRSFAARTQKSYIAAMVGLAKHYRQFPDQLTQEQIRAYLLHLQDRGLSANSQNVAISGLRFFYQQVLGWNEEQLFLPPRKRTWRLPEVLSPREVERLLCATVKLRDRSEEHTSELQSLTNLVCRLLLEKKKKKKKKMKK